jgi:tetratricopeptide (TPR) repeat protein
MLQQEALELQQRFSKMQGLFPETHLSIVAIVRALSDVYLRLSKYKLAEHWSRHLVAANQRRTESNTPQGLLDSMGLAYAIIYQDKYEEAKLLRDGLHRDVECISSVAPSRIAEFLIAQALHLGAVVATYSRFNEDAFKYSQQLIQLRISTLGPYYKLTQQSMISLASVLLFKYIYDESARIFCLLLQLQQHSKQPSCRDRCEAMMKLAWALCEQGQNRDSVAVARRSVELSQEFLGTDSFQTLESKKAYGICLHRAGLLSESEAVLRDYVAKQIYLFGEDNTPALLGMGQLGNALVESYHYEEGAFWLTREFSGILNALGWKGSFTLNACGYLGECYERQGRYVDAIHLYEQGFHETKILPNTKLQLGWSNYLHEWHLAFAYYLGQCYGQEQRYTKAIHICKLALQELNDAKGGLYPDFKITSDRYHDLWSSITGTLAHCYLNTGQYGDAAVLYEHNIAKIHGSALWTYARCSLYTSCLGICYKKLEWYSDAVALYKRSIQDVRDWKGLSHPAIATLRRWIELIYDQTDGENEPPLDETGWPYFREDLYEVSRD